MKTYVIGAAAVLLLCLAAGAAYAGYDQAFGEIKSFDAVANKLVVAVRASRDEEPKDVTYQVDKDTTVRVGREKKTLADLAVGKRVSLVYKEGEPALVLFINVMDARMGGKGGKGGKGGGGGGAGN